MKGKNLKTQQVEQVNESKSFTLYDLMNIDKSATQWEIKKQYRVLALKFHPDKNKGDQTAKEMFQKIALAYEILSNEQKRQIYDETGQMDDEQQFEKAYDYYRSLFPKISKQDIVDFEQKYRFGPMEEEDLLDHYNKHKGDVKLILQCIPLSKNEDVPRFVEFFERKINDKSIQKLKVFDQTKSKIKLLKDESASLENFRKCNREGSYESMLRSLEDKYTKKDEIKKKIKKSK